MPEGKEEEEGMSDMGKILSLVGALVAGFQSLWWQGYRLIGASGGR
jgi:hypothetical protein